MANVKGSENADLLVGSNGNDVITALGGNDVISGSFGRDDIDGGNGSDTIDYSNFDTSIAVTLRGDHRAPASFDGVDRDMLVNIENIRGGGGDDYFVGDHSDNTFWGNGGDDYFVASNGFDTYFGGDGYDMVDYGSIQGPLVIKPTGGAFTVVSVNGGAYDRLASIENILGGAFADTIVGTGADNYFRGNSGGDTLSGGAGGDRLVGGKGNDRLTGGADADIFVFRAGDGVDVITDFDASGGNHDVLDLRGVGVIDSFKDLMSMHVSLQGDNVLIYGGPGDAITLVDVDIKQLDSSDFLF